jgi:hypothetical protein
MTLSTKLLFATTLCLATGCNQYLRPGDMTPLSAQVALDQRVATWQRAIEVLLDEGYVPQVLNESACYISAKQRDDVQVGSLSGTMVIVTVSLEGKLRLEVSGSGVYASSSGLVKDIDALQQKLMQEIVARAAAPAPTPAAVAPAAPTS